MLIKIKKNYLFSYKNIDKVCNNSILFLTFAPASLEIAND